MFQFIPPAFAQIENPLIRDAAHYAFPARYTGNVLRTVISVFFVVGIIYFTWHFLMGAYHMIASEGDSKKVADAKNELEFTVVGLGIVFLVYVVLKVVGEVFGLQDLTNLEITIPSLSP